MTHFMVRYKISLWLLVASLVVTATMMHPTLATILIALPLNVVLLFLLRYVAKVEAIDAITARMVATKQAGTAPR